MPTIDACREAFWPTLLAYLETNRGQPNRGPHRHFLPMPFQAPCFAPEFFFHPEILDVAKRALDDRMVADQWGCDAPVLGSEYQEFHVDYRRPLFPETPDLELPAYMLVVNFGLRDIEMQDGPIEIIPGSHKPRSGATLAEPQAITLQRGDVLLRHPWALHRGTPNRTSVPRPLVTIRYVRRWYADESREVNAIPAARLGVAYAGATGAAAFSTGLSAEVQQKGVVESLLPERGVAAGGSEMTRAHVGLEQQTHYRSVLRARSLATHLAGSQ